MTLRLIAALDRLYEDVVADPASWDDGAFAGWLEGLEAEIEPPSKAEAREVRRAVRHARRLARFWSQRPNAPADWRSAVDMALGGRGWEPTLALARLGLEASPSAELFTEAKRRFQVAHFSPWQEGVDYEEWLAGRPAGEGTGR